MSKPDTSLPKSNTKDSYFKSEVSYAERCITMEITTMYMLLGNQKVKISNVEILIASAERCLEKCTELRHSRDALHKTISKLKRKLEEKKL